MATKDVNRLRLDLPVILPGVPDKADACVGRLVGDLEGRSGIDQVHVLPASGDEPAKLCLHYRPDVLSLGRIREIAEAAGAHVTERYGHLLWQTGGLSHERRARTVSEFLRRATGVLEAVATVAGPVRIEFDRSLTSEEVLRQLLDDLGVAAGARLPEPISSRGKLEEPRETQFKPGNRANPRGRPRGVKNTATMARQALERPVLVTHKGAERKMTVREVAYRKLADKAAMGDQKALAFLLMLAGEYEAPETGAADAISPETDLAIINDFLNRHKPDRSDP